MARIEATPRQLTSSVGSKGKLGKVSWMCDFKGKEEGGGATERRKEKR